jgi:hypothetical protein
MSWRRAVLRILGLRPIRAVFLAFAPLVDALARTFFVIRRSLASGDLDIELASPYVDREDLELEALSSGQKERLARWYSERLVQEQVLVRTVSDALARSKPAAKQHFFAWVEDRALEDEHAIAYAERTFDTLRRLIERHKGPLAG